MMPVVCNNVLQVLLFSRRLSVDQFDYGALCSVLAARTAGMSGRALSKLGVAWQAAAYASDDGRLTEQMCIDICDDAVKDHRQKVTKHLHVAIINLFLKNKKCFITFFIYFPIDGMAVG